RTPFTGTSARTTEAGGPDLGELGNRSANALSGGAASTRSQPATKRSSRLRDMDNRHPSGPWYFRCVNSKAQQGGRRARQHAANSLDAGRRAVVVCWRFLLYLLFSSPEYPECTCHSLIFLEHVAEPKSNPFFEIPPHLAHHLNSLSDFQRYGFVGLDLCEA